jgi:hypothetical protein
VHELDLLDRSNACDEPWKTEENFASHCLVAVEPGANRHHLFIQSSRDLGVWRKPEQESCRLLVRRQVTAISTKRVRSWLREKFVSEQSQHGLKDKRTLSMKSPNARSTTAKLILDPAQCEVLMSGLDGVRWSVDYRRFLEGPLWSAH